MFCHGCFFSESLPSACISVTKSKKSLLHTTMIYDHIFAWRRANMKWRTAGSMALHTTHTHTHTHIHTHFITSAPSWNWESLLEFIFLGSRTRGSYLGVYNKFTLMRKLHVRLALMLTVTFECLKTEFCWRSTYRHCIKTATRLKNAIYPFWHAKFCFLVKVK